MHDKPIPGRNPLIQSPSDITIYVPALQQRLTPQINNRCNQEVEQTAQAMSQVGLNAMINHGKNNTVSDFVESVRQEQHPADFGRDNNSRPDCSAANKLKEAQLRADKALLEAEKFKARVEPPGNDFDQNMSIRDDMQILNIGAGVSDDDFFHLTCHIDPNLIHKIEKGEFVELEKLLPKDKLGRSGEENRFEWVQRDGGTYLVPAQRDSKIGSFRRWEQAFRAYATIYCGANPHRSKEVWQYITVINTAASSFLWENVYHYDITFRHLMAFNVTGPPGALLFDRDQRSH